MKTSVQIREAIENDRSFVCNLMEEALQPYYGGDHLAHATRIFNTHIAGGRDNVGHFSFEQKMFILEDDGTPAGMVNIVGKKQGTYKISPIIIAPAAQGKKGFGSMLLTYAETYARKQGARQMYCTVAKKNVSALQFFLRKGYIIAGKSESHYMEGVTEIMLYKLFWTELTESSFEHEHVSVIELAEQHKPAVRQLILDKVPQHFGGVDESWVDALFNGYARRGTRDINDKYKLIFVATNNRQEVIGVICATPKKGEPIKLMPCVAKTPEAFTALITDAPQLLKDYGHKLY
ncbi:MAG: GNAT family N-acetyltransferase, partial [Patescibacteria group bacterium]